MSASSQSPSAHMPHACLAHQSHLIMGLGFRTQPEMKQLKHLESFGTTTRRLGLGGHRRCYSLGKSPVFLQDFFLLALSGFLASWLFGLWLLGVWAFLVSWLFGFWLFGLLFLWLRLSTSSASPVTPRHHRRLFAFWIFGWWLLTSQVSVDGRGCAPPNLVMGLSFGFVMTSNGKPENLTKPQ